ncbi:MAG TPA: hypothetical protein VLD62_10815 [Acidimicrobiia bacterium]|nr:hypothetical protein [Acidimicrobiia bacterium]
MRPIEVRAGDRVRVLRRISSSLSGTFTFDVEPLDGAEVSGIVEVAGSRWIFPKEAEILDLQPTVTVHKGFWDTFYAVYVTPDADVRVGLRRGPRRRRRSPVR